MKISSETISAAGAVKAALSLALATGLVISIDIGIIPTPQEVPLPEMDWGFFKD